MHAAQTGNALPSALHLIPATVICCTCMRVTLAAARACVSLWLLAQTLHVYGWPAQKAVADQLSRAQKASSRLKRSGAKGSSGKATTTTTSAAVAVVDMPATVKLQQAAAAENNRWGAAGGAGGTLRC
jgi:hypothetical protein